MKAKLIIVLLFAVFSSHAQIIYDKQYLLNLFQQKKYTELIDTIKKTRKFEFGKCFPLDYLVAKSFCAQGKNTAGKMAFDKIIQSYKLDKLESQINNDKNNCSAPQTNDQFKQYMLAMDKLSASVSGNPRSSVSGKGGSSACSENVMPQSVEKLRDIPAEELQSRLFKLNEGDKAVQKYKSLLNDSRYKVQVSSRFILITYGASNLTDKQVDQVTDKLNRAFDFFVSYYQLRAPDKLLAVYLLPDKAVFQQTAAKVHGMKIPDVNIGYSYISDLSLVGISNAQFTGTLLHELFHIMIRTDVGDAPAWLDEGIACIYETSSFQANALKGSINQWRTSVLKDAGRYIMDAYSQQMPAPSLKEYINFNWSEMDGNRKNGEPKFGQVCIASVNYAYGKHLMLYVQEKGKLRELVTAVKNRPEITDDPGFHYVTDQEIFENVMGKSIGEIEIDFNKWIKSTYGFSINGNDEGRTVNATDVSNNNAAQEDFGQQKVTPTFDNPNENGQVQIDAGQQITQTIIDYTADDVLSQLTLHVRKDPNDKLGNLIAFNYYVEGGADMLDAINQVLYQRPDESFPEYKEQRFLKGSNRSSNFTYKGYQWGQLKFTNVMIELKNGQQSKAQTLQIVYDN